MGNSIVVIDPKSGRMERSVFIGSEPGEMVVSDKSKYLYVLISDGRLIRRVNLETLVPGATFPVGDGIAGSRLVVVPGAPEAVGVLRHRPGLFPDNEGLAVYINGIPCSNRVNPGHQLMQGISPSRLFGYENMISSWDFVTINLNRRGTFSGGAKGGLLTGNVALAGSANGLIITGSGGVIDPEARQVIGSLPDVSEPLLAHGPTGRVFCVSGENGHYKLKAADLHTMTSLGEVPIEVEGAHGKATELIACGDNYLAFRTDENVVLYPVLLGPKLPLIDLSVQRSSFPLEITRGMEFSYTLTVTNNSSVTASEAHLTDRLPSGIDPLGVRASQGDATCTDQIVSADLSALPPGKRATVTVRVRVNATDNLVFTAAVRGGEPDPNPDNNLDIYDPSFRLADLTGEWVGIQQTSEGSGVNLHIVLQGAVIVRNIGSKASSNCILRFWAEDGLNLVTDYATLLQEIAIPGLGPGESFTAQLNAPLARQDDATGLFIFAQVDARNDVEEKSKENNTVRIKVP